MKRIDRRAISRCALALTMAVAGGACGPANPPGPDGSADGGRGATDAATDVAPVNVAACPGFRWIARFTRDDGACPPAGAWMGRFLFPQRPTGGQFCVYDAPPGLPESERLRGPFDRQPPPLLEGLATDCQVVAPLAPLTEDSIVREDLIRRVREMSDAVTDLPASLPSFPVRVAVIDSAADGDGSGKAASPAQDEMGHARTVGLVIRELACPGNGVGPCPGQIANYLALRLVKPQDGMPGMVPPRGGYFGALSDLALAIERAVDEHQAGVTPRRIVVNLSVGWDNRREYGGALGGQGRLPPEDGPAHAVYTALQKASCVGAAIVAAAGNRTGTPGERGPMFPAAWEVAQAPQPADCRRLGIPFDQQPRTGPLLFAAGGTDGEDLPIALSREGGRPRLTAYALYSTAKDPNSGDLPKVLTGTSMSAAVVSGIAAAVLGYRPDLPVDELMDLIHKTGEPLDPFVDRADFCQGSLPACDPIHRVSRCRAVAAAVAGVLTLPCVATIPARAGENPLEPPGILDGVLDGAMAVMTPIESCSGADCMFDPTTLQAKVAVPSAGPLPGSGGCEGCVIDWGFFAERAFFMFSPTGSYDEGLLTLEIEASVPGDPVTPVHFRVKTEEPPGTTYHPGTTYQIPLTLPEAATPSIRRATIQFYKDGARTFEQVLVR